MFQFPTPQPQFDSEAAADLWGAAQLLRKHGHTKNLTKNPATGQMCLGGAIAVHISGYHNDWDGERFSNAALLLGGAILGPIKPQLHKTDYHMTITELVEWNNATERLASEVIDALERTAAAHALAPAR